MIQLSKQFFKERKVDQPKKCISNVSLSKDELESSLHLTSTTLN